MQNSKNRLPAAFSFCEIREHVRVPVFACDIFGQHRHILLNGSVWSKSFHETAHRRWIERFPTDFGRLFGLPKLCLYRLDILNLTIVF
ncbi:hypothetical protein NPIL_417631 [Nephila pilipes]|uniref:Uncharacterized protein n=1 Tax=Nephila pilipes TaxID=299642 RepID=A0A8X6QNX3_NEPPI|nr:hypothetical protein NPIL_417631 [Nephila pilipes]